MLDKVVPNIRKHPITGRLVVPAARTSEVRQIFNQLFLFSKSLVDVLGPVSVEQLVSVEYVPSACFAPYGMKISILTSLWL